ncbi:hypothetical protein EDB80DRAFT_834726 [Ilyonectria destructans]|nr:hypothetical protein EDB80DRAFT_834726 [Ilyonectria destructans]
MKFTTIIGLTIAATGALAAPGGPPKPPPPPPPTAKNNIQTITCGSGAPYCCTSDSGDWGSNVKCSKFNNLCNSVVVCCNINQQNSAATQICGGFGNNKVIFG